MDKTIKVWDFNQKMIHNFTDHNESITCLDFSSNDKFLVAGCANGDISLWNIINGKLVYHNTKKNDFIIMTIKFSPNNELIVFGGDSEYLYVWKTGNSDLISKVKIDNCIPSIVFLPKNNENIIAIPQEDNICIYDINREKLINSFEDDNEEINNIEDLLLSHNISSLDINSNGIIAFGSDDKKIRILNSDNGQIKNKFCGHHDDYCSIAICPNTNILALCGIGSTGCKSSIKTIHVFDFVNGKLLTKLNGHEGLVSSLFFTKDGKYLVSGSDDNNIKIWNIKTILNKNKYSFFDYNGLKGNSNKYFKEFQNIIEKYFNEKNNNIRLKQNCFENLNKKFNDLQKEIEMQKIEINNSKNLQNKTINKLNKLKTQKIKEIKNHTKLKQDFINNHSNTISEIEDSLMKLNNEVDDKQDFIENNIEKNKENMISLNEIKEKTDKLNFDISKKNEKLSTLLESNNYINSEFRNSLSLLNNKKEQVVLITQIEDIIPLYLLYKNDFIKRFNEMIDVKNINKLPKIITKK